VDGVRSEASRWLALVVLPGRRTAITCTTHSASWGGTRIGDSRQGEILDWLQGETAPGTEWNITEGTRNGALPAELSNPISGETSEESGTGIREANLTEEETVRGLARIEIRIGRICEICIANGARISEGSPAQVKTCLSRMESYGLCFFRGKYVGPTFKDPSCRDHCRRLDMDAA